MAKNLQHLIAYSGPVESSSWTHKACWCYPWELLCCSPYISTSFEADPNRLPHNTPSTTEQENSPSPSLTPVASAHHRREEAVGWENYLCINAVIPSTTLTLFMLWLPPPSSTFCPHVLGHPHPHPGKCSPCVWRSCAVPRSSPVTQPERRLEPAVLTQDEPVQSLGTALMRH